MKRTTLVLVATLSLFVGLGRAYAGVEQNAQSKASGTESIRVNLNTASAEELARLPGIGPKVAARIVTYREENGRFQKAEELMNVRGIGEKTFSRLRDKVYVEPDSGRAKK